jgi:ribulose-5-phosphate 4-epimerase/fuculose-1-phosphate aldolase
MSSIDTLISDLVIANRILAKEDVVDAYGHVSVRHPDNPKRFFISRSLAPELIEKGDIVELDLAGEPVREEKRSLYLERFIHAGIYEMRLAITRSLISVSMLLMGLNLIPGRRWGRKALRAWASNRSGAGPADR